MLSSMHRSRAVNLFVCARCSFLRLASSPSSRTFATSIPMHHESASQPKTHFKAETGSRIRSSAEVSGAQPNESGLKGLRSKLLKQKDAAVGDASSQRIILGQAADKPIRARFAPSPTGYLHLGSLRTALFNNLAVSASKGGAFILRIEDTDQSRLVSDAEGRLLQDLKWAGLSWDEGPDCGGPHGPYRQSERLPLYKAHSEELLRRGHSYRCFCTSEQLEAQKRAQHEAGKPTVYAGTCRSINTSESNRRAAAGEAHVVRFRSDPSSRPKLRDAIYGPFQKKDAEEDFILIKTDGYPTYHFANVVDDHDMQITHVIRGEEWLVSTPKHVALYEAFGWTPPTFAHLGLLVNADGTKLSKRNASVDLSKYKEDGVFPMALLAWLANLGSSFKRDAKTTRSVEDIADALTFKFTRGGIKLNLAKLDHFNVRYRDALLHQPSPNPVVAAQEKHLVDESLVEPTLTLIDAITSKDGAATTGTNWPPTLAWQSPLSLVPMLDPSSNSSRSSYVRTIYTTRSGGFQLPTDLVFQHPYLFWRVPTAVYEQSLKSSTLEEASLCALEEVIALDDVWNDGDVASLGARVVQLLRSKLGLGKDADEVPMHNLVRLVGAGGVDVVSQSSSRLFGLLGQKEWRQRLNAVRSVLRG